jgi:CRP/FNR family transcriptional regulator
MSRSDRGGPAAILRRVPLFSKLSAADLDELLQYCRMMKAPAGREILSPETPADSFYVIVSGRVKLYKISPKGDEQILHLFGPGDTFGEAAMWGGIPYPATADALEETRLLVVGREPLRRAFTKNPEVALEMLAGMAAKLQEFNHLIEQLSLKEVPARLAEVLLQMAREAGSDTVYLKQPKRELASRIGTIAATLSRALAKLKSEKLIAVDGAKITILDRGRLEDLAGS